MEGYLGETELDIHKTEYTMYSPSDWALLWIQMYGGIDGAHHKDWVLDHVAQILNGTKVKIFEAKWSNGHSELRFRLDEPSQQYDDWVDKIIRDENGEIAYGYDTGVAP